MGRSFRANYAAARTCRTPASSDVLKLSKKKPRVQVYDASVRGLHEYRHYHALLFITRFYPSTWSQITSYSMLFATVFRDQFLFLREMVCCQMNNKWCNTVSISQNRHFFLAVIWKYPNTVLN